MPPLTTPPSTDRWTFHALNEEGRPRQFIVELDDGAVTEELKIPNGLLHSHLAFESAVPSIADRTELRKLLARLVLGRYLRLNHDTPEGAPNGSIVPNLPQYDATASDRNLGEAEREGPYFKIWRGTAE